MNTPAHAIVNLAALGGRFPRGAVLAGAVLPDVPIFGFWAWERFQRVPENVVWSHDYFVSPLQPLIDALHSFPLILILLLATRLASRALGRARLAAEGFGWSLLLHSALDFPLHHDDAHRHFFPFSDFRFRSPVSYWDPRHLGALGALLETALVLLAALALARRTRSRVTRTVLAAISVAYVALYVAFYRP